MKVEVKKIDALKREMFFEIPKERVAKVMEEVYRDIGKVAKVKGFRPGKAPRHVIEAEHSALAKEEAIKKIIPEAYQEGLKKENLIPLDLPEINHVDFKDGVVKFTASFDIRPEIKVKDYKGIKVKRKNSAVTEEEINKTLEYFKQGQNKDSQTTIDDNFAKGLGYPGLDDFKKALATQLSLDKDRQNRIDVENQIVEALLKDSKFAVPQTFVKKQIEHRIHEMKSRMKSQGMSEEDIKKREEGWRKDLKDPVEKDIKTYLLFEKIAEQEGITVERQESLPVKVMEFLLKEATWENT